MVENVYVSGMGILSPLGMDLPEHINGLKEQKCGISFTPGKKKHQFLDAAGYIPKFKPKKYIENSKSVRYMTPQVIYGVISANFALQDGNITKEMIHAAPVDTGIVYGVSIHMDIFESVDIYLPCIQEDESMDLDLLTSETYRYLPPLWVVPRLGNSVAGQISIENAIKGLNYSIEAGGNNGFLAIGESFEAILDGRAKRMICGGAESYPAILPVYKTMVRKLSSFTENDSRPFDSGSKGFIMSEAGVSMILESEAEIDKRGGKKYARVAGYSNHFIPEIKDIPLEKLARYYEKSMALCLEQSNMDPSDVDFVQACACGLPWMDEAEALAIRNLFGSRTPVTSIAGSVGYASGTSGALSAAYGLLQMDNDFIAPILRSETLFFQDELDFVTGGCREAEPKSFLCNCFDFIGNTGSLLFVK